MSFLRVVTACLCLLALGACGGSGTPATTAPTQAPPATSAATTDEPAATDEPSEGDPTPGTSLSSCQLVTPADIEAALDLDAGTVDEGELSERGTVLDPATNRCRYEGDWGGLVVDVTPTDGVNVFDAVESTFGDEAEALDIADGALWFEDNDRGYFLKGSVMVLLQFTHVTSGDLDSFRDPTIAVGEAAVARI